MAEMLGFHQAQGQTPGFSSFLDSSLDTYDPGATALLTARVLEFLAAVR